MKGDATASLQNIRICLLFHWLMNIKEHTWSRLADEHQRAYMKSIDRWTSKSIYEFEQLTDEHQRAYQVNKLTDEYLKLCQFSSKSNLQWQWSSLITYNGAYKDFISLTKSNNKVNLCEFSNLPHEWWPILLIWYIDLVYYTMYNNHETINALYHVN